MTTGRINQVTISQTAAVIFTHYRHPLLASHVITGGFPGWAFVTRLEMPPHFKVLLGLSQPYVAFCSKAYRHHTTSDNEHLIPRSHTFQAQISLSEDKDHRLQ